MTTKLTFELQLITNEIYMTTKLTVASWKWENGSVKRRCEREKGKRKRGPFPISDSKQTREVANEFSHFTTSL